MNYDHCPECDALMAATKDSADYGMCPNGHGRIVKCLAVPQEIYGDVEMLLRLPQASCTHTRHGRKLVFEVDGVRCTMQRGGQIVGRRTVRGRLKRVEFVPVMAR